MEAVAMGWSETYVLDLPLTALQGLFLRLGKRRSREILEQAATVRVAFHADKKGWRRWLRNVDPNAGSPKDTKAFGRDLAKMRARNRRGRKG